jgi:cytochrome c peroxidase
MRVVLLLFLVLRPPLGLDLYMPVPEANPLTPGKIALGKKLFNDKRLSRDQTLACVSCHDPNLAFSDGRRVARGIHDAEGVRNAAAIINRGYGKTFFWDGRANTLEQQALEPILNPKELGMSEVEAEKRTGLKITQITGALASYVRTIRSGNSPFDRYAAGDQRALGDVEKSGIELFRGKARCVSCHAGPNFSDENFHNTGVAFKDGILTDQGAGDGKFKVPTLREVARTAPYMHDGSLATLDDVLEFYDRGGNQNPALDSEIRRLKLTADEKRAVIAFLRALSGTVTDGARR